MKTNPSARRIREIRRVMMCAALAAVAGLELYIGAALAARFGQTTACQTESTPAPDINISELMAAAR